MKYKCKGCDVKGVKLWRDYGTPFHWDLWCVDCAASKSDKIDASTVREDGTRVLRTHLFNKHTRYGLARIEGELVGTPLYLADHIEMRTEETDQLGWYVPAIQSLEDPEVFWGYTSWTEERKQDWEYWAQLPLRIAA